MIWLVMSQEGLVAADMSAKGSAHFILTEKVCASYFSVNESQSACAMFICTVLISTEIFSCELNLM